MLYHRKIRGVAPMDKSLIKGDEYEEMDKKSPSKSG